MVLTEKERLRAGLKERFVPGGRRPWALDVISLPSAPDQELILDLSPDTHNGIIESVYKVHRQGEEDSEMLFDSDYAWAGLITHGRLFFQNNHGGEFPSIADFHASQLKRLIDSGLDFDSGHWAIVGTGPEASQAVNVAVFLDNVATINVFEQDPSKIKSAKQAIENLGLSRMFEEGRIRFFPGNAIEELPKVAYEVGGFSGLDLQLLLQHFPKVAFRAFLETGVNSVRPDGVVMINELMVGRWGIKIVEEYKGDPSVQTVKDLAECFLDGVGESNGFGVKDYGWRLRTASVWNDVSDLRADIQNCTGDGLEFLSEFEDRLVVDRVVPGTPHHTLTQYICPTIAGGLSHRLRVMRNGDAPMEEISRMEAVENWVWTWAEKYHRDVLLGYAAQNHQIEVVYPPLESVVAVKKE
jgi:hypothetical protein